MEAVNDDIINVADYSRQVDELLQRAEEESDEEFDEEDEKYMNEDEKDRLRARRE